MILDLTLVKPSEEKLQCIIEITSNSEDLPIKVLEMEKNLLACKEDIENLFAIFICNGLNDVKYRFNVSKYSELI